MERRRTSLGVHEAFLGPQTGKFITVQERMSRSYRVELDPSIKYKNSRAPHVEADWDIPPGTRVQLGRRICLHIIRKNKAAVFYLLPDLRRPALPEADPTSIRTPHITVYDGPEGDEKDEY